MDLVHLSGPMGESTKEAGKTESNMEMAGTLLWDVNVKEEHGKMENEFYMNKCKDINQCCKRYE